MLLHRPVELAAFIRHKVLNSARHELTTGTTNNRYSFFGCPSCWNSFLFYFGLRVRSCRRICRSSSVYRSRSKLQHSKLATHSVRQPRCGRAPNLRATPALISHRCREAFPGHHSAALNLLSRSRAYPAPGLLPHAPERHALHLSVQTCRSSSRARLSL